MTHYAFTLRFVIPRDLGREEIERRLFVAGCDDALVGFGQPGHIGLSFVRESTSAEEAFSSAIEAVRAAMPETVLIEAAPDLVGVTDIAELLGFSRQNMRKLIHTHAGAFPAPMHGGRQPLWHLVDVLRWFVDRQGRSVPVALIDTATMAMRLNVVRESRRLDGPNFDRERLAALAG